MQKGLVIKKCFFIKKLDLVCFITNEKSISFFEKNEIKFYYNSEIFFMLKEDAMLCQGKSIISIY